MFSNPYNRGFLTFIKTFFQSRRFHFLYFLQISQNWKHQYYSIYLLLVLLMFFIITPQQPWSLQEFELLTAFSIHGFDKLHYANDLWIAQKINQIIGFTAFLLFYWEHFKQHLSYFSQFPSFSQTPQQQAHEASIATTLWAIGLFGFFEMWGQSKDSFIPFLIGICLYNCWSFFTTYKKNSIINRYFFINAGILGLLALFLCCHQVYRDYFIKYHSISFNLKGITSEMKRLLWQQFYLWLLLILVYRRWKNVFSQQIWFGILAIVLVGLIHQDIWFYTLPLLMHRLGMKLGVLRRSDRALLDYLNGFIFSLLLLIIWGIFLVATTHYPQQLFLRLQGIAPHYPHMMSIPIISIIASLLWFFAILWRKNRWDVSSLRCATHVLLGTTVIALCFRQLLLPIIDHARNYQQLVGNLEILLEKLPKNSLFVKQNTFLDNTMVQSQYQFQPQSYCVMMRDMQKKRYYKNSNNINKLNINDTYRYLDHTSLEAFHFYLPKKWWCSTAQSPNMINKTRKMVPLYLSMMTDETLAQWKMNRFDYRKNGAIKKNHEILLWVGRRPTDRHIRYVVTYAN